MSAYVNFQSDAASVWKMLRAVSGKRAFDIGANGGLVSRTLARRFDEVIACEPAWESYGVLIKNHPLNVEPLNLAVSDTPGELKLRETTLTDQLGELFTDDTLAWGEHVGYRTVDAVTLDWLSETYGMPDFIKVDTEGHEVHILRGASETLRSGPTFVIECHSPAKGEEVQDILSSFGLHHQIHYHHSYGETSPQRLGHYWVTSPADQVA